jgi:hypothetical protein
MAGEGVISQNDLMRRLVTAKKVMDKVETGSFESGHVNEQILRMAPEEITEQQIRTPRQQPQLVDRDRINGTKLPESIKRAMIENPIQQMNHISLTDTLDMDFIKGAKRLMEQEGVSTKSSKNQTTSGSRSSYVPQSVNTNEIIAQLTPIIENTIRKVLDEKLNQLLTAQQTSTINENLVLKVGDSIFKGKITGVNKAS